MLPGMLREGTAHRRREGNARMQRPGSISGLDERCLEWRMEYLQIRNKLRVPAAVLE